VVRRIMTVLVSRKGGWRRRRFYWSVDTSGIKYRIVGRRIRER
jgi:hypothetical protein